MLEDVGYEGFDGCLLKPCSIDHMQALLENPRARSNRPRDTRRGPAAVLPHTSGDVEEA